MAEGHTSDSGIEFERPKEDLGSRLWYGRIKAVGNIEFSAIMREQGSQKSHEVVLAIGAVPTDERHRLAPNYLFNLEMRYFSEDEGVLREDELHLMPLRVTAAGAGRDLADVFSKSLVEHAEPDSDDSPFAL